MAQKSCFNVSANSDKVTSEETHNHPFLEKASNLATVLDGRYEGKFVSLNVTNLSKCHLSKDEISLLSKSHKFIPTPKHINKALIKEELKAYGRKRWLMWHYCIEGWEIAISPFKKKAEFNPKLKDATIEIYWSSLEEAIFSLDKKQLFEFDKGGKKSYLFT